MATQAKQKVHTGNTIYLSINGNPVGRAQSIEGSRSYGTEAIHEIGSIMPQEHVYLRYEGTISLSKMRMKQESLDQMGIGALGEEILERDVIDVVVFDKLTGQVIVSYNGCSANDMSESFATGEVSTEDITFSYLSASRV